MNSNTKRQKIMVIMYIGLMGMLVILLTLGLYDKLKPKVAYNPINEARLLVNPMYDVMKEIEEPGDYHQVTQSNNHLLEGIYVTVTDLAGRVTYSTNSHVLVGDILPLQELLYMDHYYETSVKDFVKIGIPSYKDGEVAGFIIFEISHELLTSDYDNQQRANLLLFIVSIAVFLFGIGLGRLIFKQGTDELEQLRLGLLDLTKGSYVPIAVKPDTSYRALYDTYNTLVEELQYIRAIRQKSDKDKREFLSVISHELKTPLATINAYVEGLTMGVAKDEATREKYLQILQSKLGRLSTQVNELFNYAQKEANQFKYNLEECYGDALFEDIFSKLSLEAKHYVKVQNLIPKCFINVDKIRIEQLILNLFNNAIKHSQEGGTITLCGYREDSNIVIQVSDKGEGISPKDLPYIFDYYYQGQCSKHTDYDGNGIGLALCKEIIDNHGGSIKVKSVEKQGTTFTLTLPIV